MKLIHCRIENFGCLSDLELSLDEGLSVLCRENGWGKSTFAAFIRAMFYGLSGDRKQKLEENERKRYKPWQGGVFGGSLVFEAHGKTYLVTRIFGDKEAKDEFELRDAATNRISEDYSEKLGEELFLINRDSFLRTIFVGQNDCETSVTGDIHGKIGSLVDDTRDLNSYEDAVKRLTEQINLLNPNRSSGSISRRQREITELTGAVQRISAVSDELNHEEQVLREDRRAFLLMQQEIHRLENLQAEESRLQRAHAELEIWTSMRDKQNQLKKQMEASRELFPGRVPTIEEIHERIQECGELQKAGQTMENYRLTAGEESDYRVLREQFREYLPTDEELNRRIQATTKAVRQERGGAESDGERSGAGRRKIFPLILIVLPLIFAGIAGTLFLHSAFPLILAVVGAAVGVFCYLRLTDSGIMDDRQQETISDQDDMYDRDAVRKDKANEVNEENEANEEEDPLSLLARFYKLKEQTERYRILRKQQQDYLEAEEDYRTYRDEIVEFLSSLRIHPEKNLQEQLFRLRDLADDYYDNIRDLDAVRKELLNFEESHDMKLIQRIREASGNETDEEEFGKPKRIPLEAITAQLSEIRGQKEEIETRIQTRKRTVERLQIDLDECEEQKQLLAELEGKQEEEQKRYKALIRARDGLTRAKEALTAQYTDPVFESFSYYYECLTGCTPESYRMDGDAQVTYQVQGKQRNLNTLSAGWRDLIGLCLRMALVDAMYQKEKPILILDDPFVNLDDEKMEAARGFLGELSSSYQILYFTCSNSRCESFLAH